MLDYHENSYSDPAFSQQIWIRQQSLHKKTSWLLLELLRVIFKIVNIAALTTLKMWRKKVSFLKSVYIKNMLSIKYNMMELTKNILIKKHQVYDIRLFLNMGTYPDDITLQQNTW